MKSQQFKTSWLKWPCIFASIAFTAFYGFYSLIFMPYLRLYDHKGINIYAFTTVKGINIGKPINFKKWRLLIGRVRRIIVQVALINQVYYEKCISRTHKHYNY
jgi:hypothetical protein